MIIAFVCFFIILGIISMRKGSSTLKKKSKKLKSFTSSLPPREAFKAVVCWASASTYKIDDINEEETKLVLSDGVTFTSWGFFYPVFVSAAENGKSLIEVGIKSKALQIGPKVWRAHERCMSAVKAALIAHSMN